MPSLLHEKLISTRLPNINLNHTLLPLRFLSLLRIDSDLRLREVLLLGLETFPLVHCLNSLLGLLFVLILRVGTRPLHHGVVGEGRDVRSECLIVYSLLAAAIRLNLAFVRAHLRHNFGWGKTAVWPLESRDLRAVDTIVGLGAARSYVGDRAVKI